MRTHVLDKQIPGKVDQILSNLGVYSPELVLLHIEYNESQWFLYEVKIYLHEHTYGYILSIYTLLISTKYSYFPQEREINTRYQRGLIRCLFSSQYLIVTCSYTQIAIFIRLGTATRMF